MTRIVTWLLGTVTAVTLLFGYHTSTSGPATASETVVAAPAAPDSSGTGSSDTGSSGSNSLGSSGTGSSGTGSSGTPPSGTATTVTGSVASTRWGDVQVTITVTDGRITAVDVPVYPTENGKDRQINASALPILTQETLSAQSADIDMVSGRTVDPAGPAWRIGIEDPHDPTRLVAVVPLHTGAVATSGAARRGDHVVDARTGRAPRGVASVTVVGASLTAVDIDTTAAFALGPDGARWLEGRGHDATVLVRADGTVTVDERASRHAVVR